MSDLDQDARITASWRRIAEQGTRLTGPARPLVHVERSALLALVEVAERGIEARQT